MAQHRIVKVDTSHADVSAAILGMHATCFPDLEFQELHGSWWIAYDDKKSPVAFAGLWPSVRTPGAGYLCRAGVLPSARGVGLQRRLIRVREREARLKKWVMTLSDVDPTNHRSMNNLFECGYRAFRPEHPWCGDEWVYVRKILTEGVA